MGLHAFFGLDVPARDRMFITAELAMRLVRGPERPVVYSYHLWMGQATVGVRLRF
jgi:hypothetical protein